MYRFTINCISQKIINYYSKNYLEDNGHSDKIQINYFQHKQLRSLNYDQVIQLQISGIANIKLRILDDIIERHFLRKQGNFKTEF